MSIAVVGMAEAKRDLMVCDEIPLSSSYSDHALQGALQGYCSPHVNSTPNPPMDKWVIMYLADGDELTLVRTGGHELYGQ